MFFGEWNTLVVIVSTLVYLPLILVIFAIPALVCKLLKKSGINLNEDINEVLIVIAGVIVFLISSVIIFKQGTFAIFLENAFAVAISTVAATVIYHKFSGK